VPYPFLPQHLTVISSLTIGIPAFFLALEPNDRRSRPGFVDRVLVRALPWGSVAAAATFVTYLFARHATHGDLDTSRTSATLALFGVATWVLVLVARPLSRVRGLIIGAMVVAFCGAIGIGPIRRFYALDPPPASCVLFASLMILVGGVVLEILYRKVRTND
jgi:hypothetical protein